jgi:hypothetical protein
MGHAILAGAVIMWLIMTMVAGIALVVATAVEVLIQDFLVVFRNLLLLSLLIAHVFYLFPIIVGSLNT